MKNVLIIIDPQFDFCNEEGSLYVNKAENDILRISQFIAKNKNNIDVRSLLGKSGIKPEELPAEEDIKKLERRVKTLDKQIAKKNLKGKNKTDNEE